MLSLAAINFGATITTGSAPLAVGNELFFTATDATHGNQVWETDGTAAGTVQLSDGHDVNGVNGGIFPSDLTVVGNEVFFSANDFVHGYQIWETDGTASGTQMVSDLDPGDNGIFPNDLTAVGGDLFFVGYDPTDGMQLFESNGTASGTRMVADIPGDKGYPGCYPTDLTAAGGQLYFSATSANEGMQLWSADPSTGTVTMLTSGNATGGGTAPQYLTAVGGTVYFSGFDPTNREQLWASDGTAATTERLTSGNASQGGMNPQMPTAAGGTVYFSASDGINGTQLWAMTGMTPGSAVMLTSANVPGGGVAPTNLGAVGSEVYFSGTDGVHDNQLWSSNGTIVGTGMVADIDGTATANVANLTDVNGTLFFTAYTLSSGYQVWQSNGTSAGTVADTRLNTGGSVVPAQLTAMGNNLYFTAPGATLWKWQTPTTPTVTWPSPASIVYGTALSPSQLDATASVPGSFTYSPVAGTVLGAGTDTLSVMFTPTDTADYTSTTATTTIVVQQATPTVTWPSPASIVYGTTLGSNQLNAQAAAPGTFAYTPAAGTIPGAGTQTLSAAFTPDDTTDYTSATATTTLIVSQATPTVQVSGGGTYDGEPIPATATVAGVDSSPAPDLEGVSPALTYYAGNTATGTPIAGAPTTAGTYTVVAAFPGSADYAAAAAQATFAIAPAAPAVTWATPAAIVYGTPLSSTQLDATADVPGTFTYAPAAGTILGIGHHTLSATFTPTDAVDYTTATATTTIIIATYAPTVTWATPAAIVYGTALGAAQLDASSSVPGSFAYDPAPGTILGAGTQTLSATFTPTDVNDYASVTATTTIVVSRATPAIAWNGPAPIVYGTALGAAQLDATANVPGSFAYDPAPGTILGAGIQTLSVSFTPTDSTDYTSATATTQIVVSQATPTLTWGAPAPIVYGTALTGAQLDAQASVPGTFAYSPAADTILGAGAHTLSVSFTPTDSTDYASVTTTTTVVVSPAAPSLIWNTPSPIVYGTALGAAQLDATADVPGTFTYSPGAGAIPGVGVHTLALTFTPSDPADFTGATATTTIAVAPATPTVQVSDDGGTYDGSPFAATATVSAAGGGSPASGLEGVGPVVTYYAGGAATGPALGGPPTAAGTYTVVASFAGSADYSAATSPPVTFAIAPAPTAVTLASSAGSLAFGQAVTLTATVTAGGGAPTGTVTFLDGTSTLGVVPLDASGRAVLGVSTLGLGGHSITADYGGDADRAGGQSEIVSESVAAAATQIVLVPSAVLRRKKVVVLSLTAEVEPLAPGGGVPTGVVTFMVKKKTLGTVALSGGQASLSLKPNSVLNKSIIVTYGGTDAFLPTSLAPPPVTTGSLAAMRRTSLAGPMARASLEAARRPPVDHPRRGSGSPRPSRRT